MQFLLLFHCQPASMIVALYSTLCLSHSLILPLGMSSDLLSMFKTLHQRFTEPRSIFEKPSCIIDKVDASMHICGETHVYIYIYIHTYIYTYIYRDTRICGGNHPHFEDANPVCDSQWRYGRSLSSHTCFMTHINTPQFGQMSG